MILLLLKMDDVLSLMKFQEAEVVVESDIFNPLSVDVDMDHPKVGSEAWFVERVGLPSWRINPLRDLHHVKNEDLLQFFEEKVPNKGYCIFKCKSEKVKERMLELYKSFLQEKSLPHGYFPESFVRAVGSKVLFSTPINWAHLAGEKWRGKFLSTNIILYYERGEGQTYKSAILESLKDKIVAKEAKLLELEAEKRRCHLNIDEVRKQLEVMAKAERGRALEDDIPRLQRKVSRGLVDLAHN